MSSPAKRRKTNKDVDSSSPRKALGLEYFFDKQQSKQSIPLSFKDNGERGVGVTENYVDNQESSDQAYARKLQEEFDREHQELLDRDRNDAQPKTSLHEKADGADVKEQRSLKDFDQGQQQITQQDDQKPQSSQTLSLQSATAAEDTITTTIAFDQSPLTFEPGQYIRELKQQWALDGSGSATYALLTHCFVQVSNTQSRIKIVDNLVNLLRVLIEADPQSLLPAVWLATNSISPPYIDLELGLGGSAISKALRKVCGLNNAALKTLYDKHGDAGDVAFEAKKRQSLTLRKPKPLTIKSVFDCLVKIANSKGTGSVEAKQRIVERLVQDARGAEESRYIVRTLVQHLRIGAVKTTMLIALSRAFLLSLPPGADFLVQDQKRLASLKKENLTEIWAKGEEIVKACYARRPNYNDLVTALLKVGVCDELLVRCGLTLHIPLRPMLGNITRDLGDMLVKLQGRDFSCEYKYDGQRAQVHCDAKGKVTIFSRHLEIMTDKYPDLVALVPKIRGEGVSSFILEGEVVAVDRDSGDLKTFQTLANRARKDVAVGSVKVDVCLFSFDLMYLNGEELLDRSFRERRSLLRSLFTEIPNHFSWVRSIDAISADSELVQHFFKGALDTKCEGIMVKILDNLHNPDLGGEQDGGQEADHLSTPVLPVPSKAKPSSSKTGKKSKKKDQTESGVGEEEKENKDRGARRKALLSTYEPDKRVDSWLKVKKDYNESTDTLDLIPIGAWHGQGRKSKWWSPILLAVRNPETGCLEAVTKCMSGFTDKFYQENKAYYAEGSDNIISRPAYVEYAGEPDVWFRPHEVWELVFADITLSPTYTAAIGLISEERGLSTRFPRFLRAREDKGVDEATTSDYLASLYRRQEAKAPQANPANQEVLEEVADE